MGLAPDSPYTRAAFDHRHKLASLRMEAMKQTISLALATVAIPTAVAGFGKLPHRETVPGAVFWVLSIVGMLAAILSLICGVLFLWRAPRWARDNPAATSFDEMLLDFTYPTAAVCLLIAAAVLIISAMVAFFTTAP